MNQQRQIEGKAHFCVGNAFYRPNSRVARDLGVLAAAIYRFDTGSLQVLDAMAGCGVRSLRYWKESQADWVWTNEGNPELSPILQQNLEEAIAKGCCQVTHLDANSVFFDCYNRSHFYDVVDIDNFGSPAPYLATSLWAVKIGGLLYLTSTDGRTATGHSPATSLKVYGAYARAHPAAHEQGLRLLIGAVQQQAAAKGLGIEPVFSLFVNQTYRVMLRLLKSQSLTAQNYGFIGYCHHCGEYRIVAWHKLGRVICPHDSHPLTLSGPMWLGALHSRFQLRRLQQLAQKWDWVEPFKLLQLMEGEIEFPPYFYTLGEIGRRGKMDIPKRDRMIQALQERGYHAHATHIDRQAIKTDADLRTCIAVAGYC